jgi:hypothetical protein
MKFAVLPLTACLALSGLPQSAQANPLFSGLFGTLFSSAAVQGARGVGQRAFSKQAARVLASPKAQAHARAAAFGAGAIAAYQLLPDEATPIRMVQAAPAPEPPFVPTHYREFDLADMDELEQW